jgi:RimJ/RimL family protein N-acetyltransferase
MEIRTERLLLREFEDGDWPAVLAYHRDPRYQRFYELSDPSDEDARSFVRMFTGWRMEEPRCRFQLAVTLADTGELIGNVGVRKALPDSRVAETGYELNPAHWGRGYATEAARAMLAFGFGELGLHRIHAHCVAENLASSNVLEKLGMRREGLLRQHEWIKGRWWDVLLYGILVREWETDGAG